MARRAELFVRELSDEEAALLLKLARRSRNPTVQHRAMLLFASFQGQSVSQIAVLHRASATHVAELIHAFNAEGFAALDPRRGGGRPRRIDADQRAGIVKVALARPVERGEPFTSWSLTKLRAHLIARRVVPTISRSQLWRILHEQGIRFTHHKDLEGVARSRLRGQEEPGPRPVRQPVEGRAGALPRRVRPLEPPTPARARLASREAPRPFPGDLQTDRRRPPPARRP